MNYNKNHIPISKTKRTGKITNKESITIHSTANPKSTAKNERNWLTNPSNNRKASYHIVVDDKEIIEVIPLNEQAYHSGSSKGNNESIGIEICESGNREKTIQNTVELVGKMLYERNWGVDKLVRHFDWSGKNCPNIMSANNWADWYKFKDRVQKELDKLSKPEEKVVQTISSWAKDGEKFILEHGISDGTRPKNLVTREEVWTMLERMYKLQGGK